MPKLEMQLINPTAIQKYKNYAERGLELSPIKKLTTSSEIKLHIEELKRFIEFLETKKVDPKTLSRFGNLEQACKEINSNPESSKLYKEYLGKAYSDAQRAYYKIP
jgi:hypothetical protein